ncbi:MAG: thiol reductant ABC exporter subunit CydD [Firmicutes bacterium]|nr:thiol reductant ABC exporter subunit CydD [Bacillota bacterium]
MDSRLWRKVSAAKRLTVGLGLASTLNGMFLVGQAWTLARLVSAVYLHHAFWAGVASDAWALLALIVARAAILGASEKWALDHAAAVESHLRREFLQALTRHHPGALNSPESGELLHLAVQGIEDLEVFLARYFPQVIVTATVPAIVWLGLMVRDWVSGLLVLLTLPLIPVFMVLIGQQADKASKRQVAVLNRMSGHFLEVIHGLDTLKLFGQSRREATAVRRQSEEFRRTTMKTLRIAFLSGLVLELIASLSMAFVAVAIGLRLIHGLISFQSAFMVLVLVPEFYLPWRQLGAKFHDGLKGAQAASMLFDLMEGQPAPASGGQARLPAPGPWPLAWRDLTVRYAGRERPALSRVTLALGAGQHLAIVGPSGSGKSTLLQTLLGDLPYDGDILIGGVNLKDLDLTWWRSQMAWVTQRPYFFAGTIRENLQRVAPDASPDAMEWALREAGAWELVQRFPRGWDTPIGQEGYALSGGQRQRLALARAFLMNRPVVIFDEPSQNLDLATESALMEAMARLRQGRTTLTIAHRLATVAHADLVVVLDHGEVAQVGTPADLRRQPGLYRTLLDAYAPRGDEDALLQADPSV